MAVGVRPSAVAAGDGAVWVGNLDDESVTRINPTTRLVERSIALAVDADGTRCRRGIRLGRSTASRAPSRRSIPSVNAVSDTLDGLAPRSNAGSIAVGEGSVWFVSGIGTIVRITGSETVVRLRGLRAERGDGRRRRRLGGEQERQRRGPHEPAHDQRGQDDLGRARPRVASPSQTAWSGSRTTETTSSRGSTRRRTRRRRFRLAMGQARSPPARARSGS